MPGRFLPRLICPCLALLALPASHSQSRPAAKEPNGFPSQETLTYSVEWRLIYAGDARLSLEPVRQDGKTLWQTRLEVQSGGLVSKLYKIDDNYQATMEDQFCTTSTNLEAMEGKRHRAVKVVYDYSRKKASYVEHDLLRNITKTAETDLPGCVADILSGLFKMRTQRLEPGQNVQALLSDGKKVVSARVEAQEREQIKTKAGTFNTIRYEPFVFNGVLFARKAELQVWLTDDARALPVQIRARMSFPVGSITFLLEKDEHP